MEQNIKTLIISEDGCRRLLMQIQSPDGLFTCRNCGCCTGYAMRNRPIFECSECGKQRSVTAGTFFHGMRTPLVKLFSIIAQVTSGALKSCSAFSRELDIPYSTVWRFLHKLRKVMNESFPGDEGQLVHHTILSKVLFKRSCESEPTQPTDTETETDSVTNTNTDTDTSAEKNAANSGAGIPPGIDEIRDVQPIFQFTSFIAKTNQGISRKYTQQYVAHFNFITKFRGQLRALITACVRSSPISGKQIAAYSSPEFITFPVRHQFD